MCAATVAAGLDGLARALPLPTAGQTAAAGATPLPASLGAALDALEADKRLVAALGDELVRWFVGLKRAEIAAVDARVAAAVATGVPEEEARLESWRHFFMEFL